MPSLFDELKGGLGALLDRVAGEEDGPIRELTPQQLREELTARARLRKGSSAGSATIRHPIARRADSSAAARKAREAMAKERGTRERVARQKREDAARRAQEAAFEEAKRRAAAEARRAPDGARSSSRSRTQSRPGPGRRSSAGSGRGVPFGRDKVIAEHYETLDLAYGADFPTVKAQFRKLMRKYHPDLHSGTAKQKAASELTTKFNVAYNALEVHLKGK